MGILGGAVYIQKGLQIGPSFQSLLPIFTSRPELATMGHRARNRVRNNLSRLTNGALRMDGISWRAVLLYGDPNDAARQGEGCICGIRGRCCGSSTRDGGDTGGNVTLLHTLKYA